ncbi:hypothetical protein MXM24_14570 [Enterococcus gallinarum]|uniref:hypothetical protein n=1 Tax=Enterococcus gallinarum TaxID=1353 RepID=UPI002DB791BA|nr:hypothetical protein [Enterococcus gallinarum]MEB6065003.1 hypothetical protein [Enterococcus gallinarum]
MNRNELHQKINAIKNEKSKEYLIGTLSSLIFSKEIFYRNSDIEPFIYDVFGIKYLSYVFRSRTLLFARLTKDVILNENIDYADISKKFGLFFEIETKNSIKNKTTKNISKWVQGIRNENEKMTNENDK